MDDLTHFSAFCVHVCVKCTGLGSRKVRPCCCVSCFVLITVAKMFFQIVGHLTHNFAFRRLTRFSCFSGSAPPVRLPAQLSVSPVSTWIPASSGGRRLSSTASLSPWNILRSTERRLPFVHARLSSTSRCTRKLHRACGLRTTSVSSRSCRLVQHALYYIA